MNVGDLVFTFGDGSQDTNVLRPDDVDNWRSLCDERGGLKKVEYVSANGTLIDVGQTVKDHPELLEV